MKTKYPLTAREWFWETHPASKAEWNETGHDNEFMCRITKMKGPKEEGGFVYNVNKDGTVTPWSNPVESVVKALEIGYIIYEVEYMNGRFVLSKDKGETENK